MDDPHPLIGRTLDGRYHVDALLGQGGFGAVFRARHHALDRLVAIKTISDPTPELLARFRREARIQARLRHPYLVELIDFAHDAATDLHFLVQGHVDGVTLAEHLRRRGGTLTPAEAATLIGDVLAALDCAHAAGVVHRDIKPTNIMVVTGRHRLEARLLDFGISKVVDAEADDLTATGTVLGSPAFMAPEQIRLGALGPRTDLYAVGAVLYWALTGAQPFSGTLYQVLMAHADAPTPHLPAPLPTALDAVVQRAMAKAPAERFATALEMAAALDAAAGPARDGGPLAPTRVDRPAPPADRPAPAGDPEPGPREPASAARAAWLTALLVTAALAALIAAGIAWPPDRSRRAGDAAPPATESDARPPGDGGAGTAAPPSTAVRDAILDPDAGPAAFGIVDGGIDSETADSETARADAAPPPRIPPSGAPRRPTPPPAPPVAAERIDPASPALLLDRFTRAIDRCDCADAGRALDRLSALDPAAASAARRRYRRMCLVALDGSCLVR